MKVKELFEELKALTKDKEYVFTSSGMENLFNKMQYGFFPLGIGILSEGNKVKRDSPETEIENGGIMVLGNDFGTVSYVKKHLVGIGEVNSVTILNLLNKVSLSEERTFFTNFFLGVRTHENATMTKRVEMLCIDYKQICFEFFITQLNFFNPRIVICLGHDVKNALIDSIASESFTNWKPKSTPLKNLYSDDNKFVIDVDNKELGKRKFILMPHPSYIGNLKKEYLLKLNGILSVQ